MGLAATKTEVFASVYSENKIQVLDPESGLPTRTIDCLRPRGLTVDAAGNLFAVSFGLDQQAQVLEFKGAAVPGVPVITAGLVAPFSVAVDTSGNFHVTDGGASQQVKTFSPAGKSISTVGKLGGRGWAGTYDNASYRNPKWHRR